MAKIKLEEDEVQYLIDFVKKGQKSARELTRARILLLANKNKKNTEIVEILNVGRNTDGRKKWTLVLLTEELKKKEGFETINKESVRLILKKAKLNLG